MTQIIPAILATSEKEYSSKLEKVKQSGLFEWVQIDLMDNKFVQNKSIGVETIAKYPTDLKLEAHLMVEYPESWIDELVKIGIARIIFPVEDREGIVGRIQHIKNHGISVGLSINPETKVINLEPFLNQLDLVLVMSVNPGFSGQEFMPEVLTKVSEIKKLRSEVEVEVDGGVSVENAKLIKEAGANLVVGSHLLEGDISENLEKIKKAS